VSVCHFVTCRRRRVKTAEQIEVLFVVETWCPRHIVLDGDSDPLTAREKRSGEIFAYCIINMKSCFVHIFLLIYQMVPKFDAASAKLLSPPVLKFSSLCALSLV